MYKGFPLSLRMFWLFKGIMNSYIFTETLWREMNLRVIQKHIDLAYGDTFRAHSVRRLWKQGHFDNMVKVVQNVHVLNAHYFAHMLYLIVSDGEKDYQKFRHCW